MDLIEKDITMLSADQIQKPDEQRNRAKHSSLGKAIYLSIALIIVLGFCIPQHDSIIFTAKYLILTGCIISASINACRAKGKSSALWLMVTVIFTLWLVGSSAVYMSQVLYHKILPGAQNLRYRLYLYNRYLFVAVAVLPSKSRRHSNELLISASALLCFIALHFVTFGNGLDFGVDIRSYRQLLIWLGDNDLFSLGSIFLLIIRFLTADEADGRNLFGVLSACLLTLWFGARPYFMLPHMYADIPKWLQDCVIIIVPELIFLIGASYPLLFDARQPACSGSILPRRLSSTVSTFLSGWTIILAVVITATPGHVAIGIPILLLSCGVYVADLYLRDHSVNSVLDLALQEVERMRGMALRDTVTKTYSRRWFDETLALGCESAKEGNPSIVVLMIDVDYFKGYNDNFGHRAGDLCLGAVAEAIMATLHRDRDAVARYGGDELVAILYQTDATGAKAIAERMRRAVWDLKISHPASTHDRVTVSIGIGSPSSTPNLILPVELMGAADAALYEAKALGRNAVCLRGTSEEIKTDNVASTKAPRVDSAISSSAVKNAPIGQCE